jgi:hypothetical protein
MVNKCDGIIQPDYMTNFLGVEPYYPICVLYQI